MRQQQPFVIKIKQKRELGKRPQSIWAGVDLIAIPNDHRKKRPAFVHLEEGMTDHSVFRDHECGSSIAIAAIRIGTGRRSDPQGCPGRHKPSLSGDQAIGFRNDRRRFVSTTMPVGLSAVFFALSTALRFGFGLGGA
ncbi:hypothetical protein [Mesorhizobium tianshanense]|uniref:Uncharacterized protein n=1 Tax=Mesorhizobium tianshanense TaxID=39844 RepID=A0A562MDX2_9HYPH|nr:hypothetical protein [Mesorhizobium tianshanense]TWI18062.1 hypothetical protein IQ26_07389 [Mesorhizobium tianshanense]